MKNKKRSKVFKWLINDLGILLIASVILCFLQTVAFSNIVEFFPWGAEIGNFLAAIGYSLIASYIFYWVALRDDRKVKMHRNRAIKATISSIKLKRDSFIKDLQWHSKIEITDKTTLIEALHQISPNTTAMKVLEGTQFKAIPFVNHCFNFGREISDLSVSLKPDLYNLDTLLVDKICPLIEYSYVNSFRGNTKRPIEGLSLHDDAICDLIDLIDDLISTYQNHTGIVVD